MDSALGVQLDGFAVKKKARVPLTLPSRATFASLTPTGLHPWLAYYFRLRRNNTTTPSASSAHVDGSGTPADGV